MLRIIKEKLLIIEKSLNFNKLRLNQTSLLAEREGIFYGQLSIN